MVKIGVSLKRGRQRDLYSLDEVAGRIMEAKSAILIYKRDKELRGTMTEQDTIKLLCECDAGTQMGVASLDEVLDYVSNKEFKQYLLDCKEDHQKVKEEIRSLLAEHHHEGKAPGPMAKSMSWLKTNVKLVLNESDETDRHGSGFFISCLILVQIFVKGLDPHITPIRHQVRDGLI